MTPQKKAILVGLILLVGILLALPFRHANPPDTEETPNRVARDIWLQKPVWNGDEDQLDEADPAEPKSLQENDDADAMPDTSLLQKMKDNLEPIVRRPTEIPAQQQPYAQRPAQDHSTNVATLGSELVDLPPDVVVVEKPANQFSSNNDNRDPLSQTDDARSNFKQQQQDYRPKKPAPRTIRHTVRDGDTLQSLAERYLGDSRRGLEIFNSNRAKLQNPKALPIGDELVIIVQ